MAVKVFISAALAVAAVVILSGCLLPEPDSTSITENASKPEKAGSAGRDGIKPKSAEGGSDLARDNEKLAAKVESLRKRVSELEKLVAELPPPEVRLPPGTEVEMMREENKRMREVLKTLAARGVPWVELAFGAEEAVATAEKRAEKLAGSYRSAVESGDETAAANAAGKLRALGLPAVYALTRILKNMESTGAGLGGAGEVGQGDGISPRDKLEILLADMLLSRQVTINAKVVDSAPPRGLVVIDSGKDAGVRKGMVFSLLRGKKFLGLARVDQVFRDVSRAKCLNDSKPARPGDRAISRPMNVSPDK